MVDFLILKSTFETEQKICKKPSNFEHASEMIQRGNTVEIFFPKKFGICGGIGSFGNKGTVLSKKKSVIVRNDVIIKKKFYKEFYNKFE